MSRHSHISITGGLKARLKARSETDNVPMAFIVEQALAPALGLTPPVKPLKSRPRR